jgi:predicted permease
MTFDYLVPFIPLVILILIGYISKKLGLFGEKAIKPFNKIIVTFALPCLVFTRLYDVNDVSLFYFIPNLAFIGLGAGIIIGIITFLIFRKYSHTKKFSLILPAMMGQTEFMGYPIVIGLGLLGILGDDGVIIAIFYNISTYIIFSLLKIILTVTSNDESNQIGSKDKIKQIIKSIITMPMIWAILLGIIFSLNLFSLNLHIIPDPLLRVFKYLGYLATPLAMILLGIILDFKGIQTNFKIATVVSSIKLILFPFMVYILSTLLNLPINQQMIILIESAMPCALISLNLGIAHDMDYKLISDNIIVSVLFSTITIFIILTWIVPMRL